MEGFGAFVAFVLATVVVFLALDGAVGVVQARKSRAMERVCQSHGYDGGAWTAERGNFCFNEIHLGVAK